MGMCQRKWATRYLFRHSLLSQVFIEIYNKAVKEPKLSTNLIQLVAEPLFALSLRSVRMKTRTALT